jgi:F0F1-type ATP synthase assembly protein I
MLATVAEARQTLHPAGAGAVLLGTTLGGILIGAVIGWAAGSWTIGALVGAILGIPAGVLAVYRRYSGAFS